MKARAIVGATALFIQAAQILAPPSSQAAAIEPSKSQYCSIAFSGPIVKGDYSKLVDALKKLPTKNNRIDICLNSAGGDFSETLRIVNLLVGDKGNWDTVGTVIDQGAECIAECAFIFMAGKRHEFHGISFALRRLHVGGKLAFRLPQTKASGSSVSEKDLAIAFSAAVKQVKTLMESNAKVDVLDMYKPFPKTLTAKVLTLDDDELLVVNTVEQFGAWGIRLIGLQRPAALSSTVTDASLQRACANYSRWYHGGKPATSETVSQSPVVLKSIKSDLYYTTSFKGFGARSDQYCIVFYFETKAHGPKLDISIYKSLNPQKGEYRSSPSELQEHYAPADRSDNLDTPIWYMFNPATKLEDLAGLMK